jgi:hypothetical protein
MVRNKLFVLLCVLDPINNDLIVENYLSENLDSMTSPLTSDNLT